MNKWLYIHAIQYWICFLKVWVFLFYFCLDLAPSNPACLLYLHQLSPAPAISHVNNLVCIFQHFLLCIIINAHAYIYVYMYTHTHMYLWGNYYCKKWDHNIYNFYFLLCHIIILKPGFLYFKSSIYVCNNIMEIFKIMKNWVLFNLFRY